jgi:hypothetical protein
MSNVGHRSNTALLDEPKTRIAVATAVAFGLWCAALVLIGGLLVTPEITSPSPPNLDAQLVEIEPPPAPRASTPAQATPAHAAPPANVVHATPPPVHRATPVHEEPSQHAAKPALAPARPPVTPAAPSTAPSPFAAPTAPAASATPSASDVNHPTTTIDAAANGSGHIGARDHAATAGNSGRLTLSRVSSHCACVLHDSLGRLRRRRTPAADATAASEPVAARLAAQLAFFSRHRERQAGREPSRRSRSPRGPVAHAWRMPLIESSENRTGGRRERPLYPPMPSLADVESDGRIGSGS